MHLQLDIRVLVSVVRHLTTLSTVRTKSSSQARAPCLDDECGSGAVGESREMKGRPSHGGTSLYLLTFHDCYVSRIQHSIPYTIASDGRRPETAVIEWRRPMASYLPAFERSEGNTAESRTLRRVMEQSSRQPFCVVDDRIDVGMDSLDSHFGRDSDD